MLKPMAYVYFLPPVSFIPNVIFFQFVTKESYDDALKDLQDDGAVVRTGSLIRVC